MIELLFGFTHTLELLRTVALIEKLLRRFVDVLNHPTLLLVEVLPEGRLLMGHVHGEGMGYEIELVIWWMKRNGCQYLGLGSCPCVLSCCTRN